MTRDRNCQEMVGEIAAALRARQRAKNVYLDGLYTQLANLPTGLLVAGALVAAPAFGADTKAAANPQQERMKACNEQAGRGDSRASRRPDSRVR